MKGLLGQSTYNTVEQVIKKGQLVIPNLGAWSQDFVLAGTNKVYLSQFLLHPFVHKYSLEDFNAFGNLALGDFISLLRSCSQFHLDTLDVEDFGATMAILSYLASGAKKVKKGASCFGKKGLQAVKKVDFGVDWLTRAIMTALTQPTGNTKLTLHLNNFYYTTEFSKLVLQKISELAKEVNLPTEVEPHIFQGGVVSAYFTYVSGLKERLGFVKPSLVFHEMEVTKAENTLLNLGFRSSSEVLMGIQFQGLYKYFEDIRPAFYKDSIEGDAKELYRIVHTESEPELYLPNEYCERINKILHSRKTLPKGVTVVQENPCKQNMLMRENTIASCTINLDEANNATVLYTYAQEVNKARNSLQTNGDGMPLLVTVRVPKGCKQSVEQDINRTNMRLIGAHSLNFQYEVEEIG